MQISRPRSSVPRSRLRSPDLVDRAKTEPVQVRLGAEEEPLVLMPESLLRSQSRLIELADLFLRIVVELRRPEPSRAVLGEAGFVASWRPEDRDGFVAGFAEALSDSFHSDDPSPAEGYLRVMSTARRPSPRQHTGELSEAAVAALADRLS